jgi:uncharacterized protein (TIGR03118 family)
MNTIQAKSSNSLLRGFEVLKLAIAPGKNTAFKGFLMAFALFAMATIGCKKDDTTASSNSYQQTNLVADSSGYGAARIDPNLANAWGIAIGPTGAFWIAANHTGVGPVYDRNGVELLPAVSVPGGAPTGVVYNNTSSFGTSKFIYASEDGKISAWTSGEAAALKADRSAFNAVYKGIAIASDGGADFIYAANFKGNRIDVFDQSFNLVLTKPFTDSSIPAGFAPFNVYNHDGNLYVTYAKQESPDNEDDVKGAGNGYINIFSPNGTLIKRFASQGTLNSPWGIVDAPSGFGVGNDMILVGNFGDGRINVFSSDGTYKGQLSDNGQTISIDGLWALAFPENGVPAGDQNQLFFTAGPKDERHGLFGYLSKR